MNCGVINKFAIFMYTYHSQLIYLGGSREGDRGSGPHPEKSQAAVGFLRNIVTDQPLGPIAS